MVKTKHARAIIVDWFNLCREICPLVLNSEYKWEGTITKPIQIDESLFQGKLKHNRDRLRLADKRHSVEVI